MPFIDRDSLRSDADLVAAHLEGSSAAWDQLLERYERYIFRLILRAGFSGPDAEDIYQNVCIKLYLHLEDLREIEKLSRWLAAIVRQEVIRLSQRNRGTFSLDADIMADVSAPNPLPDEVVLAEERVRLVREALHKLPEPCHRLINLLYGPEPVLYADVSTLLGMPINSVGPRRTRCLERLKKILQQSGF